jgi:glycosyltransferase involved in cell wall biosynthesis
VTDPPRRILRVIARLNVGGPAIQAITLSRRLEDRGWTTTLVRGTEGPQEGSMDHLAERLGVRPLLVSDLGRELSPVRDLRVALALRRIIRRERPAVLHTHTAKAGAVGRLAAVLAGRRRPALVVHTFHGHVLQGYFSPRKERLFRGIERALARTTDVLVAVSEEVRRDLLAHGIGTAQKLRVVPLGFDLAPFGLIGSDRERARAEMRQRLGLSPETLVVTLVARLVPIKRVDVFLAGAARLAAEQPHVRFVIAGDGELGHELRTSQDARALGERIIWPGFLFDMPALYAASDVVCLCSDNEGTPVSLIEALASGVAVASTRVGGVPSVVRDGETGLLVPAGDPEALARALGRLADDEGLRARLGAAGKEDVVDRFGIERLVEDVDRLYREGLASR